MPKTQLVVDDVPYTFRDTVPRDLPDARAFLAYLIRRGSPVPPIAVSYVKLVAKLRRQGKLDHPEQILHVSERVAANAYTRWVAENYAGRIAGVARLFPHERARLRFVRRHSLVAPSPSKMIPVVQLPVLGADAFPKPPADEEPLARPTFGSVPPLPPSEVAMLPAPFAWTLHIPHEEVAAHVDPCETCTAIVLNDVQLHAIANAFEKTWGHRDINAVPEDAFLFGAPPPGPDTSAALLQTEKVVALIGDQALTTRQELSRGVRAKTTHDVNEFISRLQEGANGVYISRDTSADRLGDVLNAIWAAWGTPA